METFIAAYMIVWLGVFLFMARMRLRMQQLEQALSDLQERQREESSETPAMAGQPGCVGRAA